MTLTCYNDKMKKKKKKKKKNILLKRLGIIKTLIFLKNIDGNLIVFFQLVI